MEKEVVRDLNNKLGKNEKSEDPVGLKKCGSSIWPMDKHHNQHHRSSSICGLES